MGRHPPKRGVFGIVAAANVLDVRVRIRHSLGVSSGREAERETKMTTRTTKAIETYKAAKVDRAAGRIDVAAFYAIIDSIVLPLTEREAIDYVKATATL